MEFTRAADTWLASKPLEIVVNLRRSSGGESMLHVPFSRVTSKRQPITMQGLPLCRVWFSCAMCIDSRAGWRLSTEQRGGVSIKAPSYSVARLCFKLKDVTSYSQWEPDMTEIRTLVLTVINWMHYDWAITLSEYAMIRAGKTQNSTCLSLSKLSDRFSDLSLRRAESRKLPTRSLRDVLDPDRERLPANPSIPQSELQEKW